MSDRHAMLTCTDASGQQWLVPATLHGAYPAQSAPRLASDPIPDPLDVGVFNERGGLTVNDMNVVMG